MTVERVHEFNFAESDGDWFEYIGSGGDYVDTQGWRTTCVQGSPHYYLSLVMQRFFPQTQLTHIEVHYTYDIHVLQAPQNNAISRDSWAVSNRLPPGKAAVVGVSTDVIVWNGQLTEDNLIVGVTGGNQDSGCPEGQTTVTKVVIRGTGDNPFVRKGELVWCHEFDFTQGPLGWGPIPGGGGDHEDTAGWITTCVVGGSHYYQSLVMKRLFPQGQEMQLTHIEVHYTYDIDVLQVAQTNAISRDTWAVSNRLKPGTAAKTGAGVDMILWNGQLTEDNLIVGVTGGNRSGSCPNGKTTVTRVLLRGTGANRFAPTRDVVPSTGDAIYVYRAPITGNYSQEQFNANPVVVDSYAIDPLNRTLWFHATQGWVRVTSFDLASGQTTVLQPVGCRG